MKKGLILFSAVFLSCSVQAGSTVRVYAAASLSNAVTEIARRYEKQYPSIKVVLVFAASSSLARQIQTGVPADIFFSADQDWMNYLVKKQKIARSQVKPLLSNELVLISPLQRQQSFQASSQFNFAQSFQGYVCTGQMESVPVGKYAKQSITNLKWLKGLQGRIVGTDSVRSALAFVERGECQAGIVYKTDALQSKKVKIAGVFPAHTHSPIVYPIALTQQGSINADAVNFMRFMSQHTEAKKIYQHYGFKL
ncbi:molybdate ABC transporter substrate-binding protein [Acinetobacter schindleri]|uniref:molybdate ABC transporter substrate-binding protein n=1 Tax=Acinetobacter schindleri TaxID=108981 RepID=UPI00209AB776|nr:molybdate ABC transporter substrate-binding protein [Acinetobacter schindleri]MCO8068119.1 molybdate ABC transporter substrate-binding protein [Acinetobacter schindleri]